MFGSDNNGNNTGVDDAVKAALANQNIGVRPERPPLGSGIYEIDRVYTDKSPFNGLLRFNARVICVSHDKPDAVGKAYIWQCKLAGQMLSLTMQDMTKFLVCPFGIEARGQINTQACKDAIYGAHTSDYKEVVEKQAFYGQPLKGKRIKIDVVENHKVKDGQPVLNRRGKPFLNSYIDCA